MARSPTGDDTRLSSSAILHRTKRSITNDRIRLRRTRSNSERPAENIFSTAIANVIPTAAAWRPAGWATHDAWWVISAVGYDEPVALSSLVWLAASGVVLERLRRAWRKRTRRWSCEYACPGGLAVWDAIRHAALRWSANLTWSQLGWTVSFNPAIAVTVVPKYL